LVHKVLKDAKEHKVFKEQWVVKVLQDFLEFKDLWEHKVFRVLKDDKVLKEVKEQWDIRVRFHQQTYH
jgi:hypothetical protein